MEALKRKEKKITYGIKQQKLSYKDKSCAKVSKTNLIILEFKFLLNTNKENEYILFLKFL